MRRGSGTDIASFSYMLHMKRAWLLPVVLMLPMLMGTDCITGNQASLSAPTGTFFCNEDVAVEGLITSNPQSDTHGAALVGVFDGSAVHVLKRYDLSPDDTISVSTTIPWEYLAERRGRSLVVGIDVGVFDAQEMPPNSSIAISEYKEKVNATNLTARVTKGFAVCD